MSPRALIIFFRLSTLFLAAMFTAEVATAQDAPLRMVAAGSLRTAMTEVARAFEAGGGPKVTLAFGASGLLRERLEKGEAADVFASADLGNPQALAKAGKAGAVTTFARNRLCALVAPGVEVGTDTLLAKMLEPSIKLGISTPKADPSGDYAWQLFGKAEALKSGAQAALETKALKLTGGPDSPQPPPDRSLYGLMIEQKKADIFLTYCTNAAEAAREVAGSRVVAVPEALAVGADYGLVKLNGAAPSADKLTAFILGPAGQQILARYGFAPPPAAR